MVSALKRLIALLFGFSFCAILLFFLIPPVQKTLLSLGVIREEIYIAGTGSMYPTFPKGDGDEVQLVHTIVAWPKMRTYPGGISLFGKRFFSFDIHRNDIVEFDNEKTRQITKEKYGEIAGFVKRVIAIAGDTLELRDGFVFLNGARLEEPYTAKARSSYGGDFLPDCQKITIPQDFVFVMGDNRKGSLDSRHSVELVKLSDIHFVLPWEEQKDYHDLWRDARSDAQLAGTTTFAADRFITLVNNRRKEEKLLPLQLRSQLTESAKRRAEMMISLNTFPPAKLSQSLEDTIATSGYENVLYAEVFTRGFYEAEELWENFLAFPDTKKLLFSSEYDDIGLGTILGTIDDCPVQLVVAHFGGYVPPNYSKTDIESWEKLVITLEEVLPSWEKALGADEVVRLLRLRLERARQILATMKQNKWLSKQERQFAQEDSTIAGQINDRIAQFTHE